MKQLKLLFARLNTALVLVTLVSTLFLTVGCLDSGPLAPTADLGDDIQMIGGAGGAIGDGDTDDTEETSGGDPDIKVGDHPSKHAVGDD